MLVSEVFDCIDDARLSNEFCEGIRCFPLGGNPTGRRISGVGYDAFSGITAFDVFGEFAWSVPIFTANTLALHVEEPCEFSAISSYIPTGLRAVLCNCDCAISGSSASSL